MRTERLPAPPPEPLLMWSPPAGVPLPGRCPLFTNLSQGFLGSLVHFPCHDCPSCHLVLLVTSVIVPFTFPAAHVCLSLQESARFG